MATRRDVPPAGDRRRVEFFRAADQVRAEGTERVSLRSVRARLKRNAGVAGSYGDLGTLLIEWKAEREYSPRIELSGMPEAVSSRLAAAGAELWKAAQAEAAAGMERERRRMEEAVAAERELRNEALALLDARDAVIEGQRNELCWYAGEIERVERHLRDVRAREFWDRVVHEIWDILPEAASLDVNEITRRVGADLVKEAEGHAEEWKPATVRKKIEARVSFKRLFAREGDGRYRRRRPEDDAA